tara:strand:- start:541 stop:741 length:201 start_codon:yes stop_codon:yes gene_type:complete
MPQQDFFYEFGYLPLVVPEKEKKGKKKNKHFLPYFSTLVNPLNKNKFFLTTYFFLNLYFCVIICIP